MQGLNNWSWKQTNVSFEAFLVGNQGWCIKGQMLRKFIWYPKSIFRFIRLSMCISKRIKWIKKKATVKNFFFAFFSIPSSSRHEKRCQMSQRIYCLFQCSKNYLWHTMRSNLLSRCIFHINWRFQEKYFKCYQSGISENNSWNCWNWSWYHGRYILD